VQIQFPAKDPSDVPCDLLAVGAGPDFEGGLAALDARLDGHLLALLKEEGFHGKPGSSCALPTLGRLEARRLLVLGTGEGDADTLRRAAATAGRAARKQGAKTVGLAFGESGAGLAAGLVEGFSAGNYLFDRYIREEDRKAATGTLLLVGVPADPDAARAAEVRAARQAWARDLVNSPPEDLYPETLAEAARTLGGIDGVTVEVWDLARCKAEQCVGIEAVGRGSTREGRLIHVAYHPEGATQHVALVGKGITFDAGGLSLKPSSAMQTMRYDMGDAATMLAATGAAAELGLSVAIDCFVGSAENMTGGRAYKLGDILRYPNGVSVEIHNTDAEGRLVLSDCLIQASRLKDVTTIVDAATLTGAAVIALGPDFAALFTADDALADGLLAAAATNAEGLWRLPLHQPYKKMLKGDWSTIKNVGGRPAGAITAALFLQHFVGEDKRWAHLDIAGPAFVDKEHGPYAPGATGEMVRSLVDWLAGL